MSGNMEDETEGHHGLKTLVFNIFQIESASVLAKEKYISAWQTLQNCQEQPGAITGRWMKLFYRK